jgi:hypothetical protein
MDFRLGFGPMSREVITAICNYTHDTKRPLMIIASRNQVDAETGYVMTTPELRELLNTLPTDYVWMCRDHCGPYFLDAEKGLSLKDAVEATKKTIAYDIEQGFNLIHIDTSRVDDTYGIAEELFKFCIDLNPNIRFEFGTEENVGVAAGAIKYKNDVAFAKNIPNLEFVVAQTGSFNPAGTVAIYRYNGTRWIQNTTNVASTTAITGTNTTWRWTGKTQFSPHGIANQGGVLPVSLTLFTAEKEAEGAKLNWTTATEQNNKGWSVEKSINGDTYTSLGFVNGNGTTGVTNDYSFNDPKISGTTYYRLKQEDFDGTIEYSETVVILDANLGNLSFQLYPNPSKEKVRLTYAGTPLADAVYNIQVLDASGKSISALNGRITDVCTGFENLNLQQGIYLVKISDNQKVLNLKMVKE